LKKTTLWVGGGAAGRFGAAFQKALGGEPIIFERSNLGGQCPRNRCACHNFFFEQAVMADLMRLFSGKSWYPNIDLSNISLARVAEGYRGARKRFFDLMHYQTQTQLGVHVEMGDAKIKDKNTVEVNGKEFTGDQMVVATGSRPTLMDIPGADLEGVLTYVNFSELTYDPKKVIVIGGGKIGVSYASIFRAFGAETTVVEKYQLVPQLDSEVRDFVTYNMRRRGIEIYEGADVAEIKGGTKVESVKINVKGFTDEVPCDTVMFCIGLTPNSEIAKPLGVEIGEGNEIVVNDRQQTNVPGIYAVGDVAGPPFLMCKSRREGMSAARNIMGIESHIDKSFIPETIFTTYEASFVGLTEEEARKKYKNVMVIKQPSKEIPALPVEGRMFTLMSLYYGQNMNGFLKAVIDADTRKFLGFHHVGYGAKDGFQYLAYLLKIGWTVDQMADLNEIFLNPEHFIQLTRLLAGYKNLLDAQRIH